MIARMWSAYQGDRGEIEIVRDLLDTGAAINTLTASDTGWDLHLHMPAQPMYVNEEPPKELNRRTLAWRLAGRTAHVQVKRTSTAGVRLKVGTVRGWITGTEAGTPTFLIVLRDSQGNDEPTKFLATPGVLKVWLDSVSDKTDEEEVDFAQGRLFPFSARTFARDVAIWGHYQELLLEHPVVDKVLHGGTVQQLGAHQFVEQVLLACLSHEGSTADEGGRWWAGETQRTASRAVELLGLAEPGTDNEVELLQTIASNVSEYASRRPGQSGDPDWRNEGMRVSALGGDHRYASSSFELADRMLAEFSEAKGCFASDAAMPSWWKGEHVEAEWKTD